MTWEEIESDSGIKEKEFRNDKIRVWLTWQWLKWEIDGSCETCFSVSWTSKNSKWFKISCNTVRCEKREKQREKGFPIKQY